MGGSLAKHHRPYLLRPESTLLGSPSRSTNSGSGRLRPLAVRLRLTPTWNPRTNRRVPFLSFLSAARPPADFGRGRGDPRGADLRGPGKHAFLVSQIVS